MVEAFILGYQTKLNAILHFLTLQNGRCIGPSASNEVQSINLPNSATRKAGGRKPLEKEMQVVLSIHDLLLEEGS